MGGEPAAGCGDLSSLRGAAASSLHLESVSDGMEAIRCIPDCACRRRSALYFRTFPAGEGPVRASISNNITTTA